MAGFIKNPKKDPYTTTFVTGGDGKTEKRSVPSGTYYAAVEPADHRVYPLFIREERNGNITIKPGENGEIKMHIQKMDVDMVCEPGKVFNVRDMRTAGPGGVEEAKFRVSVVFPRQMPSPRFQKLWYLFFYKARPNALRDFNIRLVPVDDEGADVKNGNVISVQPEGRIPDQVFGGLAAPVDAGAPKLRIVDAKKGMPWSDRREGDIRELSRVLDINTGPIRSVLSNNGYLMTAVFTNRDLVDVKEGKYRIRVHLSPRGIQETVDLDIIEFTERAVNGEVRGRIVDEGAALALTPPLAVPCKTSAEAHVLCDPAHAIGLEHIVWIECTDAAGKMTPVTARAKPDGTFTIKIPFDQRFTVSSPADKSAGYKEGKHKQGWPLTDPLPQLTIGSPTIDDVVVPKEKKTPPGPKTPAIVLVQPTLNPSAHNASLQPPFGHAGTKLVQTQIYTMKSGKSVGGKFAPMTAKCDAEFTVGVQPKKSVPDGAFLFLLFDQTAAGVNPILPGVHEFKCNQKSGPNIFSENYNFNIHRFSGKVDPGKNETLFVVFPADDMLTKKKFPSSYKMAGGVRKATGILYGVLCIYANAKLANTDFDPTRLKRILEFALNPALALNPGDVDDIYDFNVFRFQTDTTGVRLP